MKSKIVFRLVTAIFIISVIIGFIIAGITFEKQEQLIVENNELKTQVREVINTKTRDSVYIITKIIYDTVTLGVVSIEEPIETYPTTIQVYSNLLQGDELSYQIDRLLWDIQENYGEDLMVPIWKKTSYGDDTKVLYYDDLNYNTARTLRDSISYYTESIVVLEKSYDKTKGLIELYIVKN